MNVRPQTVEVNFLIAAIESKIKGAKELEAQAWKAQATGIAYKQIGIIEGLQCIKQLVHYLKR